MVHVYISGFVQGIGFRQFLKHNAIKLGVNGWVRNLPDGRVETLFDGEGENVKKMVESCKKGPFLARVRNIEVDWNSSLKLDTISFEII